MRDEVADDSGHKSPSPRGVVMYVEDDAESLLSMCTLLTVAGFDVREARTAEAAIAQADSLRNALDVLIVDYHLGGEITGTEVTETLARRMGYSVPTIILTGDPANAEVPLLGNCPVWVMPKPASTLTLIAGLHSFVAFRQTMRRISALHR